MFVLDVDTLHIFHQSVEKRFGTTRGIINNGNLEAIVDRPETRINDHYVYDTVFKKAACLFEGIIRWHPFADGNKRTALSVTIHYLHEHGYAVIVPLSAVRYTVKIAQNQNTDSEGTAELINEISIWLGKHSSKSEKNIAIKGLIHIYIPHKMMIFLHRIGFKKYASRKLYEWLAIDIYPEHAKKYAALLNS